MKKAFLVEKCIALALGSISLKTVICGPGWNKRSQLPRILNL